MHTQSLPWRCHPMEKPSPAAVMTSPSNSGMPTLDDKSPHSQDIHTALWRVAFSPNGMNLVSGSRDKTLCLWDTTTGEKLVPLATDIGVGNLEFSPDGTLLASGSGDNTVQLWNADTGTEQATLIGHKDAICGISFFSRW